MTKDTETSVDDLLKQCGFDFITSPEDTPSNVLESVLSQLGAKTNGSDPLHLEVVRNTATRHLQKAGYKDVRRLVHAALPADKKLPKAIPAVVMEEPEAWEEPVRAEELLAEIRDWIAQYVYAPDHAIVGITLWVVVTWFVGDLYFAPILTLLSPTKRSGKTLILDLLRWLCRRPHLTSGVGITSPVIFRLNHQKQPTLLIDEAEKLSGQDGRDIVGLLNQGHRRGGKVYRCSDKAKNFEVEEFDAFGFRAIATIKQPWDTIVDRSILIEMSRKPRQHRLKRFNGRTVEAEGKKIARKLCRFAQDNLESISLDTLRPEWLNDRCCDNWSSLFAIAELAGEEWLNLAFDTAKYLSRITEDGDHAEQLIHDIRDIFEEEALPQVIKSGELRDRLNGLEASPWGDYRGGNGITAHRLVKMMKRFGVLSRQGRDGNFVVRGYWLKDLEKVFEGYPPRESGTGGTTEE